MDTTPLEAVRDEYRRLAPQYEQRWATYIERTVDETLAHWQPSAGIVVDVGCGTGYLLARLVQCQPEVRAVGIDPSGDMLRRAHDKGAALFSAIEAVAESLPLADESVDYVVSTNAFHYWYDPARALAEIYRVLKPGGELVLTDWCDDYLACRLCSRWLRLTGRPHSEILGSQACLAYLEAAGFARRSMHTFRAGWIWGLMTAHGYKPNASARTGADRIY